MNTVSQAWPIAGGMMLLSVITDEPLSPEAMAMLEPVVREVEAYQARLAEMGGHE